MCYVRKKKYTQYTKKKKILWKKASQCAIALMYPTQICFVCSCLVINPVYFHCTSFVSSLSFCIFFVSFVFRFCFQCCCTRFQITAIPQNPIFVKLFDSCTNVLTHISTEATKSHFSSSTNTNITVTTHIPTSTDINIISPLPCERHPISIPVSQSCIYKADSCVSNHPPTYPHLPYDPTKPPPLQISKNQAEKYFNLFLYIFFIYVFVSYS